MIVGHSQPCFSGRHDVLSRGHWNQRYQVWHGDKMVSDIPDNLLTANVRSRGVMYYVNELVKCASGSWFLPKRWVISGGEMIAIGHPVDDTLVC